MNKTSCCKTVPLTHAEVLDGLTSVPLATEQDGVGTSGRTERELVQGDGLTASLQDALLGGLGEAEGSNRELGDLKQTDIVGDGSNNNDGLGIALRGAGGLLEDAGERDRGAVDLGEEKTVEDRLDEQFVSLHFTWGTPETRMTLLNAESVRLARKR